MKPRHAEKELKPRSCGNEANALELGTAYLQALEEKDAKKIGTLVAPDLRFTTPMVQISNREEFLLAFRHMVANARGIKIHKKFSMENQAVFTYDLIFDEPVGVVRTANVITVEDGRIAEIELFYDARRFEKTSGFSGRK